SSSDPACGLAPVFRPSGQLDAPQVGAVAPGGLMSKPKKPADLGKAGAALWASIAQDYMLRPDELTTLELACRARDRIAAMEDKRNGAVTTTGSTGQLV